jgi:chaperonin GroES
VIAAGPGKLSDSGERLALAVKVGDEVLFGKYSGSDVEVNGKELKILRESELLAKVTK